MRIVRYSRRNEEAVYGWVFEDKVGPIEGDPFGEFRRQEAVWPIESVRLQAPVKPGKIICLGRNYVEHAKEMGSQPPEIPLIFLKPASAVIGPGEPILLPPQSQQVEHEVELAVVIGKRGRWISTDAAEKYIYGYTIAMDITARDLQRRDGQWTRGKSFDSFCPLGPWIDTEFDPSDVLVTCRVNQELRQMASTRDLIFSIRQLVTFISSIMTLEAGDVILTGTPAGVGPLQNGDVVVASIEGLGDLRNPVISDSHHP